MHVAGTNSLVKQVVGQIFRHLFRKRGNKHALFLFCRHTRLVNNVVYLRARGAHHNFGVQKPRGANDLLYLRLAHAQLIIARRGRNVNELRHALLKFVKAQRPVIQAARKPKTVLCQRYFARAVALVHTAYLRHGNVTFVNNAKEVFGEVINKRIGRLARRTAIQMARVILNAAAKPQRFNHFQIVVHAHFQTLGFQQFSLFIELLQAVAQLLLNGFKGAVKLGARRYVMRSRPNGKRLVRVNLLARNVINFGNGFNFIAPKFHAQGVIGIRGEDIQRIAAHAKRSARKFVIVAVILNVNERINYLVTVHFLLLVKKHCHTRVIRRATNAVNARNACHHHNIAPRKKRTGCRVAQLFHFLINGGVFFNERVGRRHVRLGLVVVVVGNKIHHGVVGEKLLELGRQLRRKRFVGRQNERGLLHRFYGFCHGKCFAGTRYAQKRLVAQARLHACCQLFNCLRLVARGLIRRNHFKRRT